MNEEPRVVLLATATVNFSLTYCARNFHRASANITSPAAFEIAKYPFYSNPACFHYTLLILM
jgi:hypothetical protein